MALNRQRSTEVSELRGGQWKEASTGDPLERQGPKAQEQSSVPRLPGPGASINHPASFRVLPRGSPGLLISAQAYLP